MAFNIFKWILKDTGTTNPAGEKIAVGTFLDEEIGETAVGIEAYLQRMAFWACVRRIGDAVGSVEWETYRRGKKVKSKEYWAWNYSPNPNQTRSEFFNALVGQLFLKQEAIVVETVEGYRYVADAYSVEELLSGNIYRDVASGGSRIPGVFTVRDVLHFKLSGAHVQRLMTAVTLLEGRLLKSAASSYVRNSGKRGTLTIDDIAEADPDFEETYNELINEKFKAYFTADNAVLPLFKGYTYTESVGPRDSQATANTRDIRALMNDIFEITAQGLGLPSSIATGKSVTDADFQAFMTSPVQPIVGMIAQEINRKLYGSQLVFSGTYVTPNLANVRYRDIFDIANPIDKLIGSSAFCVNDILIRLGMTAIEEPWAYQHWMTKNYSPADELLNGLDGDNNTPAEPPGKEETDGEQHKEGTEPEG